MTKEELEQYRRSARFTAFNAPKIVDELIAEIERLQSEREWRDIETVKNGVLVLCCSMVAVDLKESYYVEWFVNGKPCSGANKPKATHWMPLPDAPEGGKE